MTTLGGLVSEFVSESADVSVRVRALLAAVLDPAAQPRRDVVAQLGAYYALDADQCGTNFLDGTECEQPGTVTPADLFAVTTLGITIGPAATRRLLHDTGYSQRIERSLARVPLDLPLVESDAVDLGPMADLHDAVSAAIYPDGLADEPDLVAVTGLCARKRPELFPLLDKAFAATLRLPDDPVHCWAILRDVLSDSAVSVALSDCFAAARTARPQLQFDVYPLRRLYVLVRVSSRA